MIRLRELNRYRRRDLERMMGGEGDDFGGCFMVPSDDARGTVLKCIAGNGDGWEHVSISPSLPRCPTWNEMEQIKRLFFRADEVVMQLHVATDNHISLHPYVLHLWRPQEQPIPLPPKWMV